MANETNNFSDRIDRIQSARRENGGGMGFVVHADGVVTPLGQHSSRLRFAFPLKGLMLGLLVAVSVKAYLMWFLGTDVYTLEIERLLSGTAFERTAGQVLMPDAISTWLVGQYQTVYDFVRAGLAATTAA